MIGGALLISNFINQRVENRRVAAIHQQIADLWTRQKPNLPETERYLRTEALTDHSLPDSLAQLNERLQKIRASLEAGEPQDSISAISKKTLPRDFQELLDAYELWQKSHHAASQKREWLQLSPGELTASLKSQLEETTRARTTVASRFSGEFPVGTPNWRKAIYNDLAQTLSESKERPKGTAKEWTDLLALIQPDTPLPEWITGWMASEAPMTPEQIKQLETHQRTLASNDTAPNWVTQMINSKLAKSSQAKVEHGPTKEQDTKDGKKEPLSFSFYDELKDTWPIFVAQQSDQASLIETLQQLPPIELTHEMMALISPSLPALKAAMTKKAAFLDLTSSHTVEPNGTLIWRKSKMDTSSTLAFKASRLTKLPDSFTGGKILFTKANDPKPQLAIHIATPQTHDYAVHVLNFKDTPTFTAQQSGTVVRIQGLASLLNRLNNVSEPLILTGNTPQLAAIRLNFRSNPTDVILQFQLPKVDPSVVRTKTKELNELKAAIEKDQDEITEIENSNEANRAERVATRQQDLNEKQLRATQLDEALKALQSPKLPDQLLPPGEYAIATEKDPSMKICQIRIQDASASSKAKVTP
jgi:hypothetical protein